jgi:hypothetical protein
VAGRPDLSHADVDFAEVVKASPIERLRESHRLHKDQRAYLRAMLDHQPYDYIALMSAIRELERDNGDSRQLAELYERLCLVAPDAVPIQHRPISLEGLLPT